MKTAIPMIVALALLNLVPAGWADPPTAENRFEVKLPPHRFAGALSPDSPFGINTALGPDAAEKAGAGRQTIYEDIYLEECPDVLIFGNAKLMLEFGKAGGEWLIFNAGGVPGLIAPGRPPTAVDFQIDGQRMIAQHGAKLLRHEISIDRQHDGASLHLVLGIGARAQPAAPRNVEFELTSTYKLYPRSGRLERSARLARLGGSATAPGARRMEGFVFQLPGAHIDRGAECVLDVPGPWLPRTYIAPGTPVEKLPSGYIGFHGAPDGGFGLLALSNSRRNVTVATWMDTAGEVGYAPGIRREDDSVTFDFFDRRAYRLQQNMTVESDVQQIEVVNGPLAAALEKYRQMAVRTMPLEKDTPAWVREMILLEIYPAYFPGGLKEIAKKLPFYREIGFNTVYLMPHWVGGYSPIDLRQVDPKLGTPDDLKELVRTAHGLGMKVLFDMVIHGFNERSPLMAQRPELFIHDEQGKIARHPAWKSMSTDWASPAYQQFMVDLVLHDLKEYDVDGYRVDAASYKAPNWSPDIPYPAYRSATAAPELMCRMLRAMREKKKDAVLLSEVFGPVFYVPCNLVHDNQTEAPQQLIELMDKGQATAADYKAHLANVHSMLPPGANRVYFARNHDTSWFYHFNGYTPRFMALDAIHALCGIPEVFAGDPGHGPNPDDDPATFNYYRKLFALRKDFPELARGELLLREVECGNPWVLTALRRLEGRTVLVAVSLSDKEEEATVTMASALRSAAAATGPQGQAGPLKLLDPIAGESVAAPVTPRDPQAIGIKLKLRPFQVLAGRL